MALLLRSCSMSSMSWTVESAIAGNSVVGERIVFMIESHSSALSDPSPSRGANSGGGS